VDCGASVEGEVHKNTVPINEASEQFEHGSKGTYITDVRTSINMERQDSGGCAV